MRIDTKQRKKAMGGFRQMIGTDKVRQLLFDIFKEGRRALDDAFLNIGQMVAESIMLIEREELAGPDYYPTNPRYKNGHMRKVQSILPTRRLK